MKKDLVACCNPDEHLTATPKDLKRAGWFASELRDPSLKGNQHEYFQCLAKPDAGLPAAAFQQPKIQGNVTETFSNSALNARAYSLSGQELPKPVQIGNNYSVRNRAFSLLVRDNWRVRSNLTLNLGLRYEYTGPTFEKFNHLVSLDVAQGFTAVAPVFPEQVGPLSGRHFPRSLVNADRNNFIFNTDRRLAALETLAKMYREFPERKSLIYFSSGVRTTGVENNALSAK